MLCHLTTAGCFSKYWVKSVQYQWFLSQYFSCETTIRTRPPCLLFLRSTDTTVVSVITSFSVTSCPVRFDYWIHAIVGVSSVIDAVSNSRCIGAAQVHVVWQSRAVARNKFLPRQELSNRRRRWHIEFPSPLGEGSGGSAPSLSENFRILCMKNLNSRACLWAQSSSFFVYCTVILIDLASFMSPHSIEPRIYNSTI